MIRHLLRVLGWWVERRVPPSDRPPVARITYSRPPRNPMKGTRGKL